MTDNTKTDSPIGDENTKNWFASWFDTPYYHTLYKDRNDEEAQFFMDNLTQYLNLPDEAKVLDLACGKGRHAIYLNQLGFRVTGADLSENSISYAKAFENEQLKFVQHDMRLPFEEKFDAVFNLFTSFGYFDNHSDNQKTIEAIRDSLTEYGFGVIDFMNVPYVVNQLVENEVKTVDGIDFHIKRHLTDGFIFKEIRFEDKREEHFYVEKVQALQLSDFEEMMEKAGIYLLDIFGNYKLQKYHQTESERLIMIFK